MWWETSKPLEGIVGLAEWSYFGVLETKVQRKRYQRVSFKITILSEMYCNVNFNLSRDHLSSFWSTDVQVSTI